MKKTKKIWDSWVSNVSTCTPFDKDVPWILNFNPLFEKFGFKVWWEYEYVGHVLIKSKTHWLRVRNDPSF